MEGDGGSAPDTSGYGAHGFAELYDRYRPAPPKALVDMLPILVGGGSIELVVDIGSGTGLSTRAWAEHARRVVGVEVNDRMREVAEDSTVAPNVSYVARSAYSTGLPSARADLVTASQSLHWMEPHRIFPEVGRLLRPGGVFCAYEYRRLQTPAWEPEQVWEQVRDRVGTLRAERGMSDGSNRRPLTLESLEDSGLFRHSRELALHGLEHGDGERLVGFALSEARIKALLDAGVTEEEIGLDRLRAVAESMRHPVPWWLVYRVFLGLK